MHTTTRPTTIRPTSDRSDDLETPSCTGTAPYVFVDIDGVLNTFHVPADPHVQRNLTLHVDGHPDWTYPVHIRTTVLDWLRDLGDVADVRWATTWQDAANDDLAPAFDLPTLPVACRTSAGFGVAPSNGWWKLAGVIATVAEAPRPFVWIDDEAIPFDVHDRLAHLDVPYLCIRPGPELGLTDLELLEVTTFVEANR